MLNINKNYKLTVNNRSLNRNQNVKKWEQLFWYSGLFADEGIITYYLLRCFKYEKVQKKLFSIECIMVALNNFLL